MEKFEKCEERRGGNLSFFGGKKDCVTLGIRLERSLVSSGKTDGLRISPENAGKQN